MQDVREILNDLFFDDGELQYAWMYKWLILYDGLCLEPFKVVFFIRGMLIDDEKLVVAS